MSAPEEPPKTKSSLAPLALAIAGVLALLLAGFSVWHMHRVRERDELRRVVCTSHLRQIGLACCLYSDDYDDEEFPPSFRELYPDCIDYPSVFWCPGVPKDSVSWRDFGRGVPITERSSSYTYESGLRSRVPPDFILAYDKSLDNHGGAGRNVVFVDAHVEWWPAEREAELQERLDAQRQAIDAWRKSGEPVESLKEIYAKILENKE